MAVGAVRADGGKGVRGPGRMIERVVGTVPTVCVHMQGVPEAAREE